MNRDVLRQIVNVVAFVATVVLNALANVLPLGGKTTGEISDQFQVYFVPAGYTFAIWGVIYVFLGAFAAYQALPSHREDGWARRVGYLFALTCLANSCWLFLWHYEYITLTLLPMLTLLASIVAIYVRLGIGHSSVSTAEKWLVHAPFSIYMGWITVATVANVTSALYSVNWDGWGIDPQIWAAVMLVVGAGIASAVDVTRADVPYTLVIAWAYVGIVVKQLGAILVAATAVAMVLVVGVALLFGVLRRRQRSQGVGS